MNNDATVYLVRLWHEHGTFRATARRLDEEEPHLFHTAADLARHFAEAGTGVDDQTDAARLASKASVERDTGFLPSTREM